jgi:uncharacterized protein (DUF305 family)
MRHKRYGYGLLAAGAAMVVLGACSNTADDNPAASSTSVAASSSPSATAAQAAHNNADVMFSRMMIPHHQQAIEMSDMLLGKEGIDPEITALAEQIKKAQGPEIEQMKAWLQEWGTPPMPDGMPGHNMPGHDMGQMPGMAGGHGMMSAADMTALQNAQGAEAGRLFLSQMITHHEGAITMAQQEIDTGQYPATVELARSIVTSQQAEIVTMRGLLDK